MDPIDPESVRRHVEKLLLSAQLGKSETSRKLLVYLVERSLRNDAPKETEIALDVFGKDASFNAAEDSLVRVGVRTLRQKLAEYYAGPGREDDLHLVIPKGAYRLTVLPRATPAAADDTPSLHAVPEVAVAPHAPSGGGRRLALIAGAIALLLFTSLAANVYLWNRAPAEDAAIARVRESPVWADVNASSRTLTIVLGDLFMFTQIDPKTGRTQTVRDPEINSSEELRAFLASNPAFAAERGQRYSTLIPKSAAVGMASILPIVDRPGRRVEVRVLDELQVEDIRNNDIIYIGPFVRLGPLAGHYQLRSRYRYDAATLGVTDTQTRKAFLPEGELGDERTDYGLAAKFEGPTGNHILLFTCVARNAGLLQIVRTLTSPEGLAAFELKRRANSPSAPGAFEALLVVRGFKRTDLAAEIVDVHALQMPRLQGPAATRAAFARPSREQAAR